MRHIVYTVWNRIEGLRHNKFVLLLSARILLGMSSKRSDYLFLFTFILWINNIKCAQPVRNKTNIILIHVYIYIYIYICETFNQWIYYAFFQITEMVIAFQCWSMVSAFLIMATCCQLRRSNVVVHCVLAWELGVPDVRDVQEMVQVSDLFIGRYKKNACWFKIIMSVVWVMFSKWRISLLRFVLSHVGLLRITLNYFDVRSMIMSIFGITRYALLSSFPNSLIVGIRSQRNTFCSTQEYYFYPRHHWI